MLTTLKNAFKVKEIRQRVLYTLGMLVVIRLASQLPVPGVNRDYFANWFAQQTGDAFNLLDAFTGGSFLSMSIIALNITPYITSSIIIQLLTIAIPKLEEMQKDGEEGRKKITAITRYVTVALAVIESGAMAIGFGRRGLLQTYNALNVITVIVALTAGSAFLMWIGERITEKGIGNGISVVLTINIVSRLPQDITALFNQFVAGKEIAPAVVASVIIIAVIIVMVVLVIILNSGIRKIPVQYAKKMQGRKMYGGNSSNIPLKINTAGVIPVIFASSLMQFPVIICSLLGVNGGTGFGGKVLIANGKECSVISRIFDAEELGTMFIPTDENLSGKKRWIGYATNVRGKLIVNNGAKKAILENCTSLLPIGVIKVINEFKQGEVVSIVDEEGVEFARGMVNYDSEECKKIAGAHSDNIIKTLGYKNYDAIITRDNITDLI